MGRGAGVVGGAVPTEREQRLRPACLVEHGDGVGIRDEPIVEVLDDEKRRRIGQLVPATTQALGRAGHDDRCLDPSVTTTAVPYQTQGGDGAVGMSSGTDLVRV